MRPRLSASSVGRAPVSVSVAAGAKPEAAVPFVRSSIGQDGSRCTATRGGLIAPPTGGQHAQVVAVPLRLDFARKTPERQRHRLDQGFRSGGSGGSSFISVMVT